MNRTPPTPAPHRAHRRAPHRRLAVALAATVAFAASTGTPAGATGGSGHLDGGGTIEVHVTVTTPGFSEPVDLDRKSTRLNSSH